MLLFGRMTNQPEKRRDCPRIPDFYDGKSLLVTGAAGYLGGVLLEILLRHCPGIQSIYILIREKKGVKPEARKEAIFKKEFFEKLKEETPDVFEKVHVVPGNISYPDLGLSQEDFLKITQEVSVVFHCAACISFTKSLRFLIANNSGGTQNVIELCRKCKKLEVLVYSSTLYSNCNRRTRIQEEVYRLPFPAQKFLDELKNETDERLDELISMCMPNWPNDYTFSKCLAENVLLDSALDIPVAIIRPSLIATIWRDPLRGYTEKNSAMAQLTIAVGKGFVKVLLADPNNFMDVVPVDLVANAHIIAAWRLVTERSSSPLVVNCTSYGTSSLSFQEFSSMMLELAVNNSVPNAFRQVTSVRIEKDINWYRIYTLYEHYLPALVMDTFLRLKGKKPRLVPLYQFFDKAMAATYLFMTTNWTYDTEKFKTLRDGLDKEDNEKLSPQTLQFMQEYHLSRGDLLYYQDLYGKQAALDAVYTYFSKTFKRMFYTDAENIDHKAGAQDIPTGWPEYKWSIDKRSMSERIKIAKQRHIFTEIIKKVFLILVSWLIYVILSKCFF